MSEFTKDDVAALAYGGNNAHNAKYLARHTARDHAIPDGTDVNKLRDFIKMKYVDKRWYSEDGSSGPAVAHTVRSSSSHAVTNSFGDQFGDPKIESTKQVPAADVSALFDPFGSSPGAPPAAPVTSSFGDFDPFGSGQPAPPVRSDPAADAHNTQWASFGPPAAVAAAPGAGQWETFNTPPVPAPRPASTAWDAFGAGPATAPAPTANGFGAGFDPFGAAPVTTSQPQTQHYNSGYPAQMNVQHPVAAPVMPFVKLNKDPVVPSTTEQPPAVSGFSAFDALSVEEMSVHSTGSANPFSTPSVTEQPQHSNGHPQQQQQGGFYPHQQQHGYGQPQGGHPPYPGYSGYPSGGGYEYSQQQGGYYVGHGHVGTFPPGSQPNGYGHNPGYGQATYSGPYGYPAQGNPPQQSYTEPIAPVAAPVAPDPFADMAANAWGVSGGKPQQRATQQPSQANPFGALPAHATPLQAPASANPFDLF